MRLSVVLFVLAAALIVGAAVFFVRGSSVLGERLAPEQTGFGTLAPEASDMPIANGTAPNATGEGPTPSEFEPEPKVGEVHPSLERFGVPIEAELPASANIRHRPQAEGGSLPDVPPLVVPNRGSQPAGSRGTGSANTNGDEPSPFLIEEPGPAPEVGDPGIIGPAPEESDPGIAYPPPEASDMGIQYPAPEDSDPGIDYPAPEDTEPDPANRPPET